MRRLLLAFLLNMTVGMHAILLKDGSSVKRAKADQVYYALQSLKNSPKWMLIADLFYSCNNNDGIPKKLTCIARNVHGIINEKERFETAIALELCNKDGIIDVETAHIILSSVQCMFKGCVPVLVDVHSPISWLAWTEIFKRSL